jgi:hypothetical protein
MSRRRTTDVLSIFGFLIKGLGRMFRRCALGSVAG